MLRKYFWIFAALASVACSQPAQASYDQGCTSSMRVFSNGYSGCDSVGILSPSNDTRINLVFLLADAHGQKLKRLPPDPKADYPDESFTPTSWTLFYNTLDFGQAAKPAGEERYADYVGEGTVCVSSEKGAAGFLAAVAADASLSADEKKALSDARSALKCEADGAAASPVVTQSAAGKEFAAYLAAITEFYHTNHTSGVAFDALASAQQPWVHEAARYMQARVALLGAQAMAFDDYGTLQKEGISAESVGIALGKLNAYLTDYPNGAYAASAKGLLRRAYWLQGDGAKQAAAYAESLKSGITDQSNLDVVNELDLKVPEDAYLGADTDMLLLAIQDLRLMREKLDDNDKPLPGMTAADLEKQQSRFAANTDLHTYLLAARAWFVDHDGKAVLQLLPDKPVSGDALTYLEFSSKLLRAAALNDTGDASARAGLVALFPKATQAHQRGTLELALAMSDESAKNISAVFAPDGLVHEPAIRKYVLDYIAGPILLRQQGTATEVSQDERDTALYRLFARDLWQGRYKGFGDDIALLPPIPPANADGVVNDKFEGFRWPGNGDGYPCPDVVGTAKMLNENPRSVKGRLCLGDFIRVTGVTNPETPEKDLLGGKGTLFAGKPFVRQDEYMNIIKDTKAARIDRAYALFRAVHCYQPAHSNACGGKDVSEGQRKAWYNELKAKYADTVYAKSLQYYW